MANAAVNATGWSELMDGNMIAAAYTAFDTFFGGVGIVVIILFFLYQFMLYQKTGNFTLMWVTGAMFAGLFAASTIIPATTVKWLFIMLVLELAAIIYLAMYSK